MKKLTFTLFFLVWAALAEAATITVTNCNNSGAGSLRTAINTAEGDSAADTIVFTGLGPCTIAISSRFQNIDNDLTIDFSTAAGAITIDASTVPQDDDLNEPSIFDIRGSTTTFNFTGFAPGTRTQISDLPYSVVRYQGISTSGGTFKDAACVNTDGRGSQGACFVATKNAHNLVFDNIYCNGANRLRCFFTQENTSGTVQNSLAENVKACYEFKDTATGDVIWNLTDSTAQNNNVSPCIFAQGSSAAHGAQVIASNVTCTTIRDNAIWSRHSSSITLTGSLVELAESAGGAARRGVLVSDSATFVLQDSTIQNNTGDGIECQSTATCDLGGGGNSTGNNDITGNGSISGWDVDNQGSNQIKAENNRWDNATVALVVANDVNGDVDVDPLWTDPGGGGGGDPDEFNFISLPQP